MKNSKKKRRKGTVYQILGLLLVAAALFLTGYNLWGEYQATQNAREALSLVSEMIPAGDGQKEEGANSNAKKQEEESMEASEFPSEPPETAEPEMAVRMVDGQEYIGVVEIPTLSLKLPVIREWNEERLKIAPCRYIGSVYTRDLIISGHSYKNHFRYIRKLKIGDSVVFTDMDGKRFEYEVSGTEVIDTQGVEEMAAGDWDLTLFTCTYNGSARHTVRCRLVPEENPWMDGH